MEDKKVFIAIILALIIYGILYPVTIFLNNIEEKNVQYGDGYFSDIYQNLNKQPIRHISLTNIADKSHNLFTEQNPIYVWKGNRFNIERISSNYLQLIKKDKNTFEIGTDSLGNRLYSNQKVINFIEITNNPQPSINTNFYSVITLKLDSDNYLHYSYDYIQGKVLVDIKIGTEKKPCDDIDKIVNLDITKYKCDYKDLDLNNTYEKLDETMAQNYDEKIENQNQKIFLYKRTYIGIRVPEKYIEYHDLDGIKKYAEEKVKKINKFDYIAYIFNPFDGLITCNSAVTVIFSILNFILISIFSIIKIKILSTCINNYKTYKNFIFSKMNHGIKNYYTDTIWFMNIDKANLVLEIIILFPFTCLILFLVYFGLKEFGLIVEKKVVGILERRKRIKKIKEEIKKLELNPNIPKYKINKKRLEFFKEKFHIALSCPISLDLFQDPVIVKSGHTYERDYITQAIRQTGKDPKTRELLRLDDITDNYLVNKIVQEFRSHEENFNEDTYNNIIELLKCPLSHQLFKNPYVAKTIDNKGMTYEKIYIEEYKIKNKKDPTFDVPFKGELIKNYVIQDMIEAINEMNLNKKNYSINLEVDEKQGESIESNDKKTIDLFENNNETNNNSNTNSDIINEKIK